MGGEEKEFLISTLPRINPKKISFANDLPIYPVWHYRNRTNQNKQLLKKHAWWFPCLDKQQRKQDKTKPTNIKKTKQNKLSKAKNT